MSSDSACDSRNMHTGTVSCIDKMLQPILLTDVQTDRLTKTELKQYALKDLILGHKEYMYNTLKVGPLLLSQNTVNQYPSGQWNTPPQLKFYYL